MKERLDELEMGKMNNRKNGNEIVEVESSIYKSVDDVVRSMYNNLDDRMLEESKDDLELDVKNIEIVKSYGCIGR
jgi:hypothetical protein